MNTAATSLVARTTTHPPSTGALRRAARALGLALLAWSRRPERPAPSREELQHLHDERRRIEADLLRAQSVLMTIAPPR
ncbi:hypothetical protein [Arenivirga flava]|uniref:Uncharacterized protein n=1 Tax=Arenivirga flava TaxID=1930060 RepID=A0AA37UGQ7_9MICO|nr:hypothetical protein [Arenivirga flava]GMA29170.1 hypothetical protein GCM10025874_24230 [Arenivirga flava]